MNNISTNAAKRLIISNAFWDFSRYMFRIFISLYLWTLTQNLSTIAIFELTWLVSHICAFTMLAPTAKKGHARIMRNFGMFAMLIAFIFFLFIGDNLTTYLIPASILYGLANGTYWLGYHVYTIDLTTKKNRGNFTGITQSLRILATLMGPIIIGYLISKRMFGLEYHWTFLLGIIGILMTIAIRLPKLNSVSRPFHWKETIKEIYTRKDIKRSMISSLFANMGQIGAIRRLIPLYLFAILGSELQVGGWITFFTALSIITTFSFGKIIDYKKYKSAALTSATILSISIFTLITNPSLGIYIMYGSLKEIFSPITSTARRTYYLNLLHTIPEYNSHKVEYILTREWFNLTGRIISYTPLLFITNFNSPLIVGMITMLAIATFLEGYFTYSIKAKLETI